MLRDTETDATSELAVSGMFVAIGHDPEHHALQGPAGPRRRTATSSPSRGSTRTSIPGVFAGGDVQDRTYRQAITAAGSGCMAALEAERYLEALGDRSIAG